MTALSPGSGRPVVSGTPSSTSLLLFVNDFSASRLAFGVRTFGRSCHGLAVFGNDRTTRAMEFPASLLVLKREGVGIYLLHRGCIPRRSSDRVFFAIVFDGGTGIDSSTILSFAGDSQL